MPLPYSTVNLSVVRVWDISCLYHIIDATKLHEAFCRKFYLIRSGLIIEHNHGVFNILQQGIHQLVLYGDLVYQYIEQSPVQSNQVLRAYGYDSLRLTSAFFFLI